MSHKLGGIDVHKKILAVVVADVKVEGQYQLERRQFGSNPEQLRLLSEWLIEHHVEEVVMEPPSDNSWNRNDRASRKLRLISPHKSASILR